MKSFIIEFFTKYYYDDQIKDVETGGACSTRDRDAKCIKHSRLETWMGKTTRNT